ncbi:3-dehydroquinate dehydratase [Pontimonas salivibrio]|jgi:3-dehydroquinate dehydratase-2|uniref:3-dehydroquinate dehydratase n=1 Tax=Pontimonas salivibrio TaxID=1159327 RepID=A0A2L2BQY0_9MICO|nr:type II 3-dehydroquinate dehydratase [Pontimonas salivibrio]AVG24071.1 3-dehydroquinate dehydratase [Pontimonas salivibrio]
MQSIWVINGPNLGRLGTRQPEIYGTQTGGDIHAVLQGEHPQWDIQWKQSNDEGEIIGWLHEAIDGAIPVVLNPAAFSHYSYALRDACAMVTEAGLPLIEVHLSNPAAREEFRTHSVISAVATGVIQGFGADSYRLALAHITAR